MAVITAYATDAELGAYILAQLGDMAKTIGWREPADANDAVQETLDAYGIEAITSVTGFTNARRLRALARVQAWRAALAHLSAVFDFTEGGTSASQSQMYRHATAQLALAERDAQSYDAGYAVAIDPVIYGQDPYSSMAVLDRLRP